MCGNLPGQLLIRSLCRLLFSSARRASQPAAYAFSQASAPRALAFTLTRSAPQLCKTRLPSLVKCVEFPAIAAVVMRPTRASRLACLITIRAVARALAACSSALGPPSRRALHATARNQFALAIAIVRRRAWPVSSTVSGAVRMDIVPILAGEASLVPGGTRDGIALQDQQ
jgi:hypothetical protein